MRDLTIGVGTVTVGVGTPTWTMFGSAADMPAALNDTDDTTGIQQLFGPTLTGDLPQLRAYPQPYAPAAGDHIWAVRYWAQFETNASPHVTERFDQVGSDGFYTAGPTNSRYPDVNRVYTGPWETTNPYGRAWADADMQGPVSSLLQLINATSDTTHWIKIYRFGWHIRVYRRPSATGIAPNETTTGRPTITFDVTDPDQLTGARVRVWAGAVAGTGKPVFDSSNVTLISDDTGAITAGTARCDRTLTAGRTYTPEVVLSWTDPTGGTSTSSYTGTPWIADIPAADPPILAAEWLPEERAARLDVARITREERNALAYPIPAAVATADGWRSTDTGNGDSVISVGAGYLRATTTTAADTDPKSGPRMGVRVANAAPCTPGELVTASIETRTNVPSGQVVLFTQFYDATGAYLDQSAQWEAPAAATDWVRLATTRIAPQGAAKWTVAVIGSGAAPVGAWADARRARIGGAEYLDGDSPGAEWDGTPGTSTSTRNAGASVSLDRSIDGGPWQPLPIQANPGGADTGEPLTTNQATNPRMATLTGANVIVGTNQIRNPSFEVDTTAWVGGAGCAITVVPDTGVTKFGTNACQVVPSADLTTNGAAVLISEAITVPAGQTVASAAIWVRRSGPNTPTTVRAILLCYQGTTYLGQAGAGAVIVSTLAGNPATYNQARFANAALKPGTDTLRIGVYPDAVPWPAGAPLFVDGAQLHWSTVLSDFYDGDTPAAGDFTYAYTGTRGASTSVKQGLQVAGYNGAVSKAISSTEWASSGTRSLRHISQYPNNGSAYIDLARDTAGSIATLARGQTWTVLATSRVAVARAIAPAIQWSVSGMPGESKSASADITPGVYQLRLTFTVPDDPAATGWRVRLYNNGPEGGPDCWWDDILFCEGDYQGPYFDGATRPAGGRTYTWNGAADASTSTATGPELTWTDGAVPTGVLVMYRARVDMAGGTSLVAPAATVEAPVEADWWARSLGGETVRNIAVAADPEYSRTESTEVVRPLGRAGAVVVSAGMGGADWQAVITTNASNGEQVQATIDQLDPVWWGSPWGWARWLRTTSRSWTRSGAARAGRGQRAIEGVETDDPILEQVVASLAAGDPVQPTSAAFDAAWAQASQAAALNTPSTVGMQAVWRDERGVEWVAQPTDETVGQPQETTIVSRYGPEGELIDTMTLVAGGHGSSLAVQHVDGTPHLIWSWQYEPTPVLCRIPWQPGATITAADPTSQPISTLRAGRWALNLRADRLVIRDPQTTTSALCHLYRWSDVLTGGTEELARCSIAASGTGHTLQGLVPDETYLYELVGIGPFTEPARIYRHRWGSDWADRIDVSKVGTGSTLAGSGTSEAEGLAFSAQPGPVVLLMGVKQGPTNVRRQDIYELRMAGG